MEITDYVPIRSDLDRHPKVLQIALRLPDDETFWQWAGWCNDDRDPSCNESLLVSAAVRGLVRVWALVRRHGKRKKDDAFLENCPIVALDYHADTPGIGDAMESVGWVKAGENGIAIFPNYFRNNTLDSRRERDRIRKRNSRADKKASADNDGLSADGHAENVTQSKSKSKSKRGIPKPLSIQELIDELPDEEPEPKT